MPHNLQRCSSVATNLHESSSEGFLRFVLDSGNYPFIANNKTETAPHKDFHY